MTISYLIAVLCVLAAFTITSGSASVASASQNVSVSVSSSYHTLSLVELDRLATCSYDWLISGLFLNEDWWESGNTVEAISNHLSYIQHTKSNEDTSRWIKLIDNLYSKTQDIFDSCFDDHQWYLLAYVRAYEVTQDVRFLQRALVIFDFTAQNAWKNDACGGGIIWCPDKPYKNAITNELFLSSSMALHPYTSVLHQHNSNITSTYFIDWAIQEWNWFSQSSMIDSQTWLINDGLTDTCTNNQQTTWTYNQGVFLDGAFKLAVSNDSRISPAQQYHILSTIANVTLAVIKQLTNSQGILQEPCSSSGCDDSQRIFKGIFMRHLMYLVQHASLLPPSLASILPVQEYQQFILQNAQSVAAQDYCSNNGYYGVNWSGPCNGTADSATTTAAVDLFTAAAFLTDSVTSTSASTSNAPVVWMALGLGNCEDNNSQSMTNCNRDNTDRASCQAAAETDAGSVAFDVQLTCLGHSFCRVRTTSTSCPSGWTYEKGSATSVTRTNGESLTICMVKV